MRVFLLADDGGVAMLVRELAKGEGWELRCRGTSVGAVEEARVFRPDLVLLDADLGGGLGGELCRRLRAEPGLAATPVLLLARAGSLAERERPEGCELMAKPPDFEELRARMRLLLGAPSGPDPAAVTPGMAGKFAEFAVSRLARAEALAGRLGGPDEPEALPELREIAHKFAGTAEAFGFTDAGRTARELEALLTAGRTEGAPSATGLGAQVLARLARLRAQLGVQ